MAQHQLLALSETIHAAFAGRDQQSTFAGRQVDRTAFDGQPPGGSRRALAQRGREYFRIECLRETAEPGMPQQDSPKPYYETWGEKRISEGKYTAVIRFREHILPITDEIFRYALRTPPGRPYRSVQPNSAPMVSGYE